MLGSNIATVQQLNEDTEEYKLYRDLLHGNMESKAIGKEEDSGIALAKTYGGILASNNSADIGVYIERLH